MAAPAHSHQHWTLIITGDRVCCIKSSEIKSQWNPFTMTFSSDQGMKPGLSLPARHKSCGNYKTFFSSSETNPFSPCWSGWCGYWMPRLPRVYCLPDYKQSLRILSLPLKLFVLESVVKLLFDKS